MKSTLRILLIVLAVSTVLSTKALKGKAQPNKRQGDGIIHQVKLMSILMGVGDKKFTKDEYCIEVDHPTPEVIAKLKARNNIDGQTQAGLFSDDSCGTRHYKTRCDSSIGKINIDGLVPLVAYRYVKINWDCGGKFRWLQKRK
jgi:hypothetical protein